MPESSLTEVYKALLEGSWVLRTPPKGGLGFRGFIRVLLTPMISLPRTYLEDFGDLGG